MENAELAIAPLDSDELVPSSILGKTKGFVPLPSDPTIPLTSEQLDALFPPANRPAFLRELVRRVQGMPDLENE